MAPSTAKSSKRAKSEISKVSSPGHETERSAKRETYRPENIIEYKLSDRRFLDIGWTVKPSMRITSKIIQYEARMAKPHMNWFYRHRNKGTRYYDDHKTPFITFHENASGQVFYPNGTPAITVKRPKKRTYNLYTVFTPGRRIPGEHQLEQQMLAVFDALGNGIVLNEDNHPRLTYNQIGGIFLDNKMPYVWTWSRKKTEAKIESADTETNSTHLRKLMQLLAIKSTKSSAGAKTPKSDRNSGKKESTVRKAKNVVDQDEIIVEKFSDIRIFDKSRKANLASVKIICLRLNRYLSLRIVDRHSISLRFSSRNRSIRIELGTIVNFEKPFSSYSVKSSEGLPGMLRSRFEFERLDEALTPENSLYDVAQEYKKIEKIIDDREIKMANATYLRL